MTTDAVVLGAELDAWVAALRLHELGHSVDILTNGVGSLHYACGGVRLLGYAGESDTEPVGSPLPVLDQLEEGHPYRLAGAETTERALSWFFETADALGLGFRHNGINLRAFAAAGPPLPVYAPARFQATRDLIDKPVTLVRFTGHRDFPAALMAMSLTQAGCDVEVIEVDGPGKATESVMLARALDEPAQSESFFASLKSRLPGVGGVVAFPAVLGLKRHRLVVDHAEQYLGARCLELATLPPSVPGMRVRYGLETALQRAQVPVRTEVGFAGGRRTNGRCEAVMDSLGRVHEGAAFVVATGGVLMGGLQVETSGEIREVTMDLPVLQSSPLNRETIPQSLDALHRAGIVVDSTLRPCHAASRPIENVFVAGRSLADWNPAAELSAEGVSIVTGWLAAEGAHEFLTQ